MNKQQQYSRDYYIKNRESILAYQKERWAKVIENRWYKRKVQENAKISESYKKRNAKRREKNKTTWRDKEIIKK